MTKTTKPAGKKAAPPKKPPAKPARRRLDWEAIERDYRTGKFTLRELAAKHGAGFGTIGQRAAKEGWTKDLQDAVRQATSARLIEVQVAQETHKSAQESAQNTVRAVLAAAEVNTQVILRHRQDVADTRDLAKSLLAEVSYQSQNPEVLAQLVEKLNEDQDDQTKQAARRALREALSVHGRVSSVQKLADTLDRLQKMERKAFNLDEPEAGNPGGKGAKPGASVYDLRDDDLVADILEHIGAARQAKQGAAA